MHKKITIGLLTLIFCGMVLPSMAQDLSDSDYEKALWMTTRFYGAQRSGDYNWTILDHPEAYGTGTSFANDNDNGYDLSGGWFDCGDHVKFGQTQYYSGYMILKAYAEFKDGWEDYYSPDYVGYDGAGNWTFEGGAGQPNGIPDILDEVKHATDYFIKCARNSSTFYYEVGNGSYDHAEWVTSAHMQNNPVNTGGEPRPSYKNPNDAAMASFCSATLALMSRMYRPFDPTYADLCLQHAEYAYDYAQANPGAVGAASGSFYGPNDNWKNAWGIANAEMYLATGETSYRSTAYALATSDNNGGDVHPNAGYTFDYSNNGELALYVLAEIGHPTALGHFNSRIQSHFLSAGNYNGEGAYDAGGGWGKLRYVGNAAYLIALYDKVNGNNSLNSRFYDNVDYILGANNANFSFIVGFGSNYPLYPHHRNAYLNDNNPGNSAVIQVNPRNSQLGAMVGGSLTSGGYNDERNDYVNSEVCIDYNAGITGALGALRSFNFPIDTNKFLTQCSSPGDLGGDQTLCGAGSITLDAGLGAGTDRTFQWYRDEVSQGSASPTQSSITVTDPGVWKVVVDSAGECQRSASVTITGSLGAVDLGSDIELCDPATATLDAGISGSVAYAWTKDGDAFADTKTVEITEAATYEVTVSASGCPSVNDQIVVTSLLPEVQNDTICAAGTATLEVTSTGGPYGWYTSEGATTPVFTGNPYTPTITGTTTYYVSDDGSFSGNVGPTSYLTGGQNWGVSSNNQLEFEVLADFTIDALKVSYGNVYGDQSNATISIEILDQNGNSFTPARIFTSNPTTTSSSMANSLIRFEFTGFDIKQSWGSTLRMRVDDHTNIGDLIWTQNGASYPYNSNPAGIVSITGSAGGNNGNNEYMYFYDWEVSSGVSCAKKPVIAVLDPAYTNCGSPDSDGDGTPDDTDVCPNDPNKDVDAGDCGCGVAETDSDSDGVADCIDICTGGDDNADLDNDGTPDFCDNDADGDGVDSSVDCDDMNASIGLGTTYYVDNDGDSYGDENDAGTVMCTNPGTGYSTNNTDCNDSNPGINPGATDIPGNGTDEDCDGSDAIVDSDGDGVSDGADNCPNDANADQADDDSDGVGNVCDICTGGDDNADLDNDGTPDFCDNDADGDGVDSSVDCDDMDAGVGAGQTWYADTDGDGFGDPTDPLVACTQPTNYVANNTDQCPADINKQNPGTCGCGVADTDSDSDGVADCDDICPGSDDNADLDNDGTPDGCDTDADGDGLDNTVDCNDMNASIGLGATYYVDNDGDSYGDENDAGTVMCTNPGIGYSTNNTDCNDSNPGINPGAAEIPGNGTDEDCDGSDAIVDSDGDGVSDGADNCPNDANADQADDDSDGVGNVCDICTGGDDNADLDNDGTPDFCDNDADGDGVDSSLDCDDMNASIGLGTTYYVDNDGDSYGDENDAGTVMCTNPGTGYSTNNTDCNDSNPGINPGATDIPGNGTDEDCDGSDAIVDSDGDGVSDGADNCPNDANADQADDDSDGVGNVCDICTGGDDNADLDNDGTPDFCDNDADGDGVDSSVDCDDMNASIGLGTTYYVDNDGDSYGDENDAGTVMCTNPGTGYSTNNTDCNDSNPGINPGAAEIPGNGTDEDCDGLDAIVDSDGDGVSDGADNCPNDANADQADDDSDGVGNVCDICTGGDDNADLDNDGTPDFCDNDADGDGVDSNVDCDDMDAGVGAGQTWYADTDGDGFGDPNNSQVSCAQPANYVGIAGDQCPADVNKTEPGNCGCGIVENTCNTMSMTIIASDDKICVGEDIYFSVKITNEEPNTTYTWNFGTGATPNQKVGLASSDVLYATEGEYTVTLTANTPSGTLQATEQVSVKDAVPEKPIVNTPTSIPCGSNVITLSVTNAQANTYYDWVFENGIIQSGQNTSAVDVLFNPEIKSAEQFNVIAYDEYACEYPTSSYLVAACNPTAIKDIYDQENIDLYPNPFTDEVIISYQDFDDQTFELSITDMTGTRVLEGVYDSNKEVSIDASTLKSGMYIVTIVTSKDTYTSKVVKLQ